MCGEKKKRRLLQTLELKLSLTNKKRSSLSDIQTRLSSGSSNCETLQISHVNRIIHLGKLSTLSSHGCLRRWHYRRAATSVAVADGKHSQFPLRQCSRQHYLLLSLLRLIQCNIQFIVPMWPHSGIGYTFFKMLFQPRFSAAWGKISRLMGLLCELEQVGRRQKALYWPLTRWLQLQARQGV